MEYDNSNTVPRTLEEIMKPYQIMGNMISSWYEKMPQKEKDKLARRVKRTNRRDRRYESKTRFSKIITNSWYHQKWRSPAHSKPVDNRPMCKRITTMKQLDNGTWSGIITIEPV